MLDQPFMHTRGRHVAAVILLAGLAILLTLLLMQTPAEAGHFSSGAGNCGDFDDAIELSEDGDTVLQMIPVKNTSGVVISKALRISGGWSPTVNCEEANQLFTDTVDFLAYGFAYSPTERSILQNFDSILPFDLQNKSLVIENIELDGDSDGFITADNGGGITGVISNSSHVLLDNMLFGDSWADLQGGGIYLMIDDGSHLTIEDSVFNLNTADDNGGGLYISLTNGSSLTIDRSTFTNNDSLMGGGFEIHVDATSELTIQNSLFDNNRTTDISGNGGGGILMIDGGQAFIINTRFSNNDAGQNGGGLYVEMNGGELLLKNTQFVDNEADTGGSGLYVNSTGSSAASLTLDRTAFEGNGPADAFQTSQTGTGALDTLTLDNPVYVPSAANSFDPALQSARIISVGLDANLNYQVYFETNFQPQIPGTHLHFFFDTVAPENSGTQGSGGTWKIYAGDSPFTGYAFAERPYGVGADGAEKMCVLVANSSHATTLGTGNCVELP